MMYHLPHSQIKSLGKALLRVVFVMLVLGFGSSSAEAATRYWRGTLSTSWNNTNNWSATSGGATGVSVPGSADDIIFDSGGNNPCLLDAAVNVFNVTIASTFTNTITQGSGNTVTIGNNYSQAAGTVTLSNSTFSAANGNTTGGIFDLGTASASRTFSSTFTLNGGTISALNYSGTMTVGTLTLTTGTFKVNNTPGAMTLAVTSGNTLSVAAAISFNNGTTTTSDNFSISTGPEENGGFGAFISTGDMDGDGENEIFIGAPRSGHHGIIYVYDSHYKFGS